MFDPRRGGSDSLFKAVGGCPGEKMFGLMRFVFCSMARDMFVAAVFDPEDLILLKRLLYRCGGSSLIPLNCIR
jgi:hypothetical protein